MKYLGTSKILKTSVAAPEIKGESRARCPPKEVLYVCYYEIATVWMQRNLLQMAGDGVFVVLGKFGGTSDLYQKCDVKL